MVRPTVVVAAIGNPLRGDDGAAWRVAEHAEQHWRGHGVNVLVGQQVLPEWAAVLADADVVYFVDAARGRADVALEPLEPSPPLSSTAMAHSLGPASVLRMAADLFGGTPESYLLALPAMEFGFDESLSPIGRRSVSDGIRTLDRALEETLRRAA
jgi:hydrogenase maturation protease